MMRPTDKPESWWEIFYRAADLRSRFQEVEKTKEREEKRALVAEIKDETFRLLNDADLPDPLRMLIVDLWEGDSFLGKPQWAKFTAAAIEGRHPVDPTGGRPSTLGKRKLGKLLRDELGVETDFSKQIAEWRNDPDYWRRVFDYRPDWHWSPDHPPRDKKDSEGVR